MSTRDKILEILENDKGKFVSGQHIAENLKISRTAIWKAIKILKHDGYRIISVRNNGYKLSQNNDILSEIEIKKNLLADYKKTNIQIFKTIDSTNNLAKKIIASNSFENATTIIANEQTSGRGRFARTFFSPANTGIYMSTILKTKMKLSDVSLITVISALSVCRAIKKLTNIKPEIKWINDIFIDGKKVCGILTEAVSDFETLTTQAVVVGIGINVSTKKNDFPEEIQNKVISVATKNLSRNVFIAEILNNLFSFFKDINKKEIIEEYKSLSLVLNKKIKYLKDETVMTATAIDINDKGNLIVKDNYDKVSVIEAGEISVNLNN